MQDNWISVKEKLPDININVIGYDELYDSIGEAKLCEWNHKRLVFINNDDCNITHWMSFPKPPKNITKFDKKEII